VDVCVSVRLLAGAGIDSRLLVIGRERKAERLCYPLSEGDACRSACSGLGR
jgi:hypothetical protein